MKKILSIDAETNGLWGRAFAIAAVLRREDGTEETFLARCPIAEPINDWVRENVLPEMEEIEVTHSDYVGILSAFAKFYLANYADANVIVHMGLPVEARLFIDAHNIGVIGDWEAPYPLIDISAFPEIGTSVDAYNAAHGLHVPKMIGGTHNPLYDAYAALIAYDHIMH